VRRARSPGESSQPRRCWSASRTPVTAIQTPQTSAQTVNHFLGHADRADFGRDFGATDVVAERGEEGVERVCKLTGGDGTHTVLECVGLLPALETALAVWRATEGTVSRVGAPQYSQAPLDFGPFMPNITLTGGVAPARVHQGAHAGRAGGPHRTWQGLRPTVNLEDIADGYRTRADRKAIKVIVEP
jgi:threonine dehydrogenase-like Zn-dependent dehydrogenase